MRTFFFEFCTRDAHIYAAIAPSAKHEFFFHTHRYNYFFVFFTRAELMSKRKREFTDDEQDGGPSKSSRDFTLWVRDRYNYPPVLVHCEKSDTVAKWIRQLVKIKPFSDWMNTSLLDYTVVKHEDGVISHNTCLNNIPEVTFEDPLTVEQHVPCDYYYVFMLHCIYV